MFGGGTEKTSDGFHLQLLWFQKVSADAIAKELCFHEPQMMGVGGQPSSIEFGEQLPEMV